MDTEKCRALLHVVESGNIRASAAELGYTPSGLSRMMASLEKEFGLTLLTRSRQGVRPTAECQALLPAVKRVAQAATACIEQAHAIAGLEEGSLRIGIAYPQFYPVLTQVLGAFSKEHPGIQVSVREANSTPLANMLAEGDLDFAIISKRKGPFEWHELIADRLVALVPADHPLAGEQTYPLERFTEDPYIEIGPGEDTDNYLAFQRFGIVPRTCFSVSLDSAGYEMVDAGLGVTLTNAIHAESHAQQEPGGRPHAIALPTAPVIDISIGIATASDVNSSPAAKAFKEFALPRFKANF